MLTNVVLGRVVLGLNPAVVLTDHFQVWDGASAMVVDTSKVSYPSDYDFFINPFTDDSADWNN